MWETGGLGGCNIPKSLGRSRVNNGRAIVIHVLGTVYTKRQCQRRDDANYIGFIETMETNRVASKFSCKPSWSLMVSMRTVSLVSSQG